jgi:hypothetical protein
MVQQMNPPINTIFTCSLCSIMPSSKECAYGSAMIETSRAEHALVSTEVSCNITITTCEGTGLPTNFFVDFTPCASMFVSISHHWCLVTA